MSITPIGKSLCPGLTYAYYRVCFCGIQNRLEYIRKSPVYDRGPTLNYSTARIDTLHAQGRGWKRPESNARRSEEHTSELQSLMRISYADFCLKKKKSK